MQPLSAAGASPAETMFEVELRNIRGRPAAIGTANGHTLVVDRPADDGGEGLGFNGGELLYLAVAGCISNDLFREARRAGIDARRGARSGFRLVRRRSRRLRRDLLRGRARGRRARASGCAS